MLTLDTRPVGSTEHGRRRCRDFNVDYTRSLRLAGTQPFDQVQTQ